MVWKQDLAKLKQQLKTEEGPVPPAPQAPAKRAEKPAGARPLDEEDALFLQSMGRRPAPPPPGESLPSRAQAGTSAAPVDSTQFADAMANLRGVKPVDSPPPLPAPAPSPSPKPPLISQLLAASEETRPLDAPPPPPEAVKAKGPVLIQLAAGMAIEVDGLLDLRNHTLSDARERLKERLEDAVLLGWRSMHVLLGPSEALRQGFLAFLTTPAARTVQRYAQAPVPMGGPQAWILYLSPGQP